MNMWILIADESRARVFGLERPSDRHLMEIADFVNPAACLPVGEMEDDAPGSFAGDGDHRRYGGGEAARDRHDAAVGAFATRTGDEIFARIRGPLLAAWSKG